MKHKTPVQACSENEDFREFYEAVAEHYPEEDLVYRALRGIVRQKFVLHHMKQLNGRLLDLGCNRGSYSSLYRNGPTMGIDISHTVLRAAAARVPKAFFVQADAQRLSCLRPATFDAILCTEVLEHVLKPERVIASCHSLLRPGGKLLLTTPNYSRERPTWVPLGQLAEHNIQGPNGRSFYHSAFRPEELAHLARSAGFEKIEVGTFEKEVKYATRIPVVFFHIINRLNVIMSSDRIDSLNRRFLEKTSLYLYRMAVWLRVDPILRSLVHEGVRTFLIATK